VEADSPLAVEPEPADEEKAESARSTADGDAEPSASDSDAAALTPEPEPHPLAPPEPAGSRTDPTPSSSTSHPASDDAASSGAESSDDGPLPAPDPADKRSAGSGSPPAAPERLWGPSALQTPAPSRSRSSDVTRPVTPEERSAAATHDSRNGTSTSAEPAPSADESFRKAAHRLPTGSYPVVGESASMRPRNAPPPEPADLFRPPPRADQKPDRPHPLAPDGTVAVGSARAAADASGLSPAKPLAGKPDGKKA
jgi:hypothetical protein